MNESAYQSYKKERLQDLGVTHTNLRLSSSTEIINREWVRMTPLQRAIYNEPARTPPNSPTSSRKTRQKYLRKLQSNFLREQAITASLSPISCPSPPPMPPSHLKLYTPIKKPSSPVVSSPLVATAAPRKIPACKVPPLISPFMQTANISHKSDTVIQIPKPSAPPIELLSGQVTERSRSPTINRLVLSLAEVKNIEEMRIVCQKILDYDVRGRQYYLKPVLIELIKNLHKQYNDQWDHATGKLVGEIFAKYHVV